MSDIIVRWIETSALVYESIRAAHPDLRVFGSATRMENSSLGDRLILTDWGFREADAPLLRYEDRGEAEFKAVKFYLGCAQKDHS